MLSILPLFEPKTQLRAVPHPPSGYESPASDPATTPYTKQHLSLPVRHSVYSGLASTAALLLPWRGLTVSGLAAPAISGDWASGVEHSRKLTRKWSVGKCQRHHERNRGRY